MTKDELEIIQAFKQEYERLCDLFIIRPEKHRSYQEVEKLLNAEKEKENE